MPDEMMGEPEQDPLERLTPAVVDFIELVGAHLLCSWKLGSSQYFGGYAYTKREAPLTKVISDRRKELDEKYDLAKLRAKLNSDEVSSTKYRSVRKGWIDEDFPLDLTLWDIYILLFDGYYYGGEITIFQDRTFTAERNND